MIPEHETGTYSLYVKGCRCDSCRAAAVAYSRDYRARKAGNVTAPPHDAPKALETPLVRYIPDTPLGPVVACTVCDDFYQVSSANYKRNLMRIHGKCVPTPAQRRQRGLI